MSTTPSATIYLLLSNCLGILQKLLHYTTCLGRSRLFYLLDILKNDKEEEGALQTKPLEINLMYSPPRRGHFLECTNRCVATLSSLPRCNSLFFGDLSKEESLDYLKEILTHDARRNFKVAVQVATKYSEELEARDRIELFLSFKSYEVLYYYLVSIVNFSKDPEDHFRYIEAVARVGQWSGVERVTRESSVHEPERTMNFLRFFNSICLTYVNCSPYHVPITVLATKKQR